MEKYANGGDFLKVNELSIDASILLVELKEANQNMGKVIESIQEVAKHTNLLSLNSAI
ncbi:MAG: chemotaxis protein, partial [Desulfitobacterium hafniense]